MTTRTTRPLSPHLTIWKWGPHMLVSILNRATGIALTVGGLVILTWWLVSVADGARAHAQFASIAGHPLGIAVLVGLTWAFWMHFFAGLRHIVMDTGSGFELRINRFFAVLTIVASLFATALTWFLLVGVNR